jgi:hypothetical protein
MVVQVFNKILSQGYYMVCQKSVAKCVTGVGKGYLRGARVGLTRCSVEQAVDPHHATSRWGDSPGWCYSGVTVVLEWCYSGFTVV